MDNDRMDDFLLSLSYEDADLLDGILLTFILNNEDTRYKADAFAARKILDRLREVM